MHLELFQGKRQAELPLLIFGVLSLVGAAAAVLLPETANQPLPQTLSDGNELGVDQGGKKVNRIFLA